MTEAYIDYLVRSYHMNMWGHTIVKDAVSFASLSYTQEDRLELLNSEGWVDEVAACCQDPVSQLLFSLSPAGSVVSRMMYSQASQNRLEKMSGTDSSSQDPRNLGTNTWILRPAEGSARSTTIPAGSATGRWTRSSKNGRLTTMVQTGTGTPTTAASTRQEQVSNVQRQFEP